jgi:hypothetical protein
VCARAKVEYLLTCRKEREGIDSEASVWIRLGRQGREEGGCPSKVFAAGPWVEVDLVRSESVHGYEGGRSMSFPCRREISAGSDLFGWVSVWETRRKTGELELRPFPLRAAMTSSSPRSCPPPSPCARPAAVRYLAPGGSAGCFGPFFDTIQVGVALARFRPS